MELVPTESTQCRPASALHPCFPYPPATLAADKHSTASSLIRPTTTPPTALRLTYATPAAAKMMTRSKTREAAENFSANIVGSKKIMENHASIESVMMLEEFNSMNRSDNEYNCSLDDNFNTSLTSSITDSGVTEDFQDAESTLQASDNIRLGQTVQRQDLTALCYRH